MKKFKNILTAAIAAAITLTATGMTASAFTTSEPDAEARFHFNFGYAEMENRKDFIRHASAKAEIVNRYTGTSMKTKSGAGKIGFGESVPAIISNYDDYRNDTFKTLCSGIIHSAGSPYSTIDWDPERTVYTP